MDPLRRVVRLVVWITGIYAVLLGALFVLMLQPPLVFGKAISKLPGPVVFMLVPFKALWFFARGGPLRAGDPAPDFRLQTFDKMAGVQLSSFRGQKPVVLVFGSYT